MLSKIFFLLQPSEKREMFGLIILMLLVATLDMIGVASILPFMAVLANRDLIQSNQFLETVFNISRTIGVETIDQFLFVMGLTVFILLVISLSLKAYAVYLQTQFALQREYSIGERLVTQYLSQPYNWFLGRHSADLGKTVLSEVRTIIDGCLAPMMQLISQVFVTTALMLLVVLVDPLLALSVGLVLGIAYAATFLLMGRLLTTAGNERIQANADRYTALSEAFSSVKAVKIEGVEAVYVNRFSAAAKIFANGQAIARIVGQLPRFALEAISFGGMLVIILYLMATRGNFAQSIPVISLYAFVGYRLLPALQQIYQAVTQIRFTAPALDALYKDLTSLQVVATKGGCEVPLKLQNEITLANISHFYDNSSHAALHNININIQAGSIIGLAGPTGSGKSTLLDIMLGLLEPKHGCVQIDGRPIDNTNRRSWQRNIGYVPQQISLIDDSISANIAFGTDPDKIDYFAVERASKLAQLHDFVIGSLPKDYSTIVGEQGVRLSGGQRQRIGIARALYRNPQVLFLDEATSALDILTEEEVIRGITSLENKVTIIMVAHRLTTLQQCDMIYFLDKGSIVDCGTYCSLEKKNIQFAKNKT